MVNRKKSATRDSILLQQRDGVGKTCDSSRDKSPGQEMNSRMNSSLTRSISILLVLSGGTVECLHQRRTTPFTQGKGSSSFSSMPLHATPQPDQGINKKERTSQGGQQYLRVKNTFNLKDCKKGYFERHLFFSAQLVSDTPNDKIILINKIHIYIKYTNS